MVPDVLERTPPYIEQVRAAFAGCRGRSEGRRSGRVGRRPSGAIASGTWRRIETIGCRRRTANARPARPGTDRSRPATVGRSVTRRFHSLGETIHVHPGPAAPPRASRSCFIPQPTADAVVADAVVADADNLVGVACRALCARRGSGQPIVGRAGRAGRQGRGRPGRAVGRADRNHRRTGTRRTIARRHRSHHRPGGRRRRIDRFQRLQFHSASRLDPGDAGRRHAACPPSSSPPTTAGCWCCCRFIPPPR